MMITKNVVKFITGFCSSLALMGFLPGNVSAQVIDDVNLHTEKDNVVITIRLSSPVNYKRHFPVSRGKTLDIYYDILDPLHTNKATRGTAEDPWQDGETRNSPPTSLIPSFTVKTEDQQTDNPEVVIEFDHDMEYTVRPGDDGRSFLIFVPKAQPGVEEGLLDLPEIGPASPDQKQAEALMMDGRNGLQANNYPAAIDAFNKLLQLPPNAYTQDAQEWIGVARERAGQTDKARLEYESYLKQYTGGMGVARVKERLAKMAPPVKAGEAIPVKEKKPTQTTTFGNLSMTYSRSTTTQTDVSYLLTNVDLSERFRSDEYDNRMVFRDTFNKNYLTKPSKNKLTSAYFDMKNKPSDTTARFGRQPAGGGGVVGRFDGISAGHGFSPVWRVSGVAGQLADSTLIAKPVFYGMKVDISGKNSGWNGSLFAINQTMGGITDRRGTGGELRYFDTSKSVYALLDYDASYHVLNTAMLQGSVNNTSGTTLNFLVDHRKSLMTGMAFAGATTLSLDDLLNSGLTVADIRQLARDRTPVTNLAQLGITHPLNEKWQIGGDIKVANTLAMPASGRDPTNLITCPLGAASCPEGFATAVAATGNQWSVTGQVIGSNILSSQDTTLMSLSYMTSPTLNAQVFSVSNRSVLHEKWTLNPSWQYYQDRSNTGLRTTKNQPTIKVSYLLKDRVNFEAESGVEIVSRTPTRKFFSLGFRWDF